MTKQCTLHQQPEIGNQQENHLQDPPPQHQVHRIQQKILYHQVHSGNQQQQTQPRQKPEQLSPCNNNIKEGVPATNSRLRADQDCDTQETSYLDPGQQAHPTTASDQENIAAQFPEARTAPGSKDSDPDSMTNAVHSLATHHPGHQGSLPALGQPEDQPISAAQSHDQKDQLFTMAFHHSLHQQQSDGTLSIQTQTYSSASQEHLLSEEEEHKSEQIMMPVVKHKVGHFPQYVDKFKKHGEKKPDNHKQHLVYQDEEAPHSHVIAYRALLGSSTSNFYKSKAGPD